MLGLNQRKSPLNICYANLKLCMKKRPPEIQASKLRAHLFLRIFMGDGGMAATFLVNTVPFMSLSVADMI